MRYSLLRNIGFCRLGFTLSRLGDLSTLAGSERCFCLLGIFLRLGRRRWWRRRISPAIESVVIKDDICSIIRVPAEWLNPLFD